MRTVSTSGRRKAIPNRFPEPNVGKVFCYIGLVVACIYLITSIWTKEETGSSILLLGGVFIALLMGWKRNKRFVGLVIFVGLLGLLGIWGFGDLGIWGFGDLGEVWI